MRARPEEISNIIKEQIKNYRSRIEMKEKYLKLMLIDTISGLKMELV